MSRIMIVDDEESILKALRRVLRIAPCVYGNKNFSLEVEAFSSPAEALERARQETFDLFISDFRMPEMDGIEFLKGAKALQPEPWNDYDLMSAIGQALAHRELLLENRELANLVRLEMGDKTAEQVEAERLEAIEPGITEVNWGPDGSVLLDPEFQPKD